MTTESGSAGRAPDAPPPSAPTVRRGGRPSKLTPETQARIVAFIRAHNYVETAAALAGVGSTTFYRWMQAGEAATSGRFREFRDAIKAAELEAEAFAVKTVRESIRGGDWKAAMTWLERKFPDRWARRARVEMTGKDGGPIETKQVGPDLSKLTREELVQLEAILSRANPDTP